MIKFENIENINFLHYGAIVSISAFNPHGNNFGQIWTTGLFNERVWLSNNDKLIENDPTNKLFKILSPFDFIAFEKLLQKVRQQGHLAFQDNKFNDLLEAYYIEISNNHNKIRKNMKSTLEYGEKFVLQHVNTGKFLSCQVNTDNSGSSRYNPYQVRVQEIPNQYCIFTVQPSMKYQFESNKTVITNTPVYIVGIPDKFTRNTYLTSSLECDIDDYLKDQTQVKEQEIQISTEYKALFSFDIYYPYFDKDNLKKLMIGDIVCLQHTEKKSLLSLDSDMLKENKISVFFDKGSDSSTFMNMYSLWQIYNCEDQLQGGFITETDSIRFRHLITGQYLAITKDNDQLNVTVQKQRTDEQLFNFQNMTRNLQEQSTYLENDNFLKLWHPQSQTWLGVQKITDTKKVINIEGDEYRSAVAESSIRNTQEDNFRAIVTDKNTIYQTQYIQQCIPFLENSINVINKIYQGDFENESQEYIQYLLEDLEQTQNIILSIINFTFSSFHNQNIVFEIDKPNKQRQDLLNKFGVIQKICQLLKSAFPDQKSLEYFLNLGKIFQNDQNKQENLEKIKIIQKQMDNNYKQHEIEIFLNLQKICMYCYNLLINLCQNNPEFQQLCFQYIGYFYQHVGFGLGAQECIQTLAQDNEKILLLINEIDIKEYQFPEKIKNYLSLDLEYTNNNLNYTLTNYLVDNISRNNQKFGQEYLSILSSLCIFKGKGMSSNQLIIHEALLKNGQFKNNLIQINCNNYKFNIETTDYNDNNKIKRMTLDELCQDTKQNQMLLIYLKAQLELYGNLCMSRNYVGIDTISQIFSFDVLSEYILKDKVQREIKACLVKLLTTLYIDVKPRAELIIPNVIRQFQQTEDQNMNYQIIQQMDTQSQQLKQVIQTIKQLINKELSKTKRNSLYSLENEKEQNTAIYYDDLIANMIILLSKMAFFGAFQDVDSLLELINILKPLIFPNQQYQREKGDNNFQRTMSQKSIDIINNVMGLMSVQSKKQADQFKKKNLFSRYGLQLQLENLPQEVVIEILKSLDKDADRKANQEKFKYEIEVKKQYIILLDFIINVKMDISLNQFMDYFYKLNKKIHTLDLQEQELILAQEFAKAKFIPQPLFTDSKDQKNKNSKNIKQNPIFEKFTLIDTEIKDYLLPHIVQIFLEGDDVNLLKMSLEFILKMFNQTSLYLKTLKQIQILHSQDDFQYTQTITAKVLDLKFYSEQSEIWMIKPSSYQRIIENYIQTLQTLQNSLKPNINKTVFYRQTLLVNKGLVDILLQVLRDSTKILKFMSLTPEDKLDKDQLLLKQVFSKIYDMLYQLCDNDYYKVKKMLFQEMELFKMQLPLYEVGQSKLVTEIYNKQTDFIRKVPDSMLILIKDLILKKGRKVGYIEYFINYIQEIDINLKKSKNKSLLKLFLNQQDVNTLLYRDDVKHKLLGTDIKYSQDQPILYHQKLYQLFESLIKNIGSSIKLRNQIRQIFSPDQLWNIILLDDAFCCCLEDFNSENAKSITFLKFNLINLLKEIWLKSEQSEVQIGLEYINQFIKKETLKLNSLTEKIIINMKNGTIEESWFGTDQYQPVNYLDYLIESLIPCIFSLQNFYLSVIPKLRINSQNNEGVNSSQFLQRNDLQSIIEFYIAYKKKSKFIREQIREKIEQVKIIQQFEDNFQEFDQEYQTEPNKKFQFNAQTEIGFSNQDISQNVQEEFVLDMTKIKHPFLNSVKENVAQSDLQVRLWQTFIINLTINENIKKKIEDETYSLIHFISNLDQDDTKIQTKNEIIFAQQRFLGNIAQLLGQLKLSQDNQKSRKLIKKCINFLTLLVSNGDQATIIKYQNILNAFNTTQYVLDFICDKTIELNTFILILRLLNKMLEGGNQNIQSSIYDYFIQNEQTYILFNRINQLLAKDMEQSYQDLDAENRVNFVLIKIKYNYKLKPFTVIELLQFLQLLTENHNKNLQQYIRQQKNCRTSIDMQALIVKYLDHLIKDWTISNFIKMIYSLGCLTEFIQGSHTNNDLNLIEGNILQIIQKILKKKENAQKSKIQKSLTYQFRAETYQQPTDSVQLNQSFYIKNLDLELKEKIIAYFGRISTTYASIIEKIFSNYSKDVLQDWMINKVKYKALVLLESLIEGKNYSFAVVRTLKEIPINILQENLVQVYYDYKNIFKGIYSQSAFGHYNIDENSLKMAAIDIRHQIIIEIGFKIYIIFRNFLDLNEDDVQDVELQNELHLFKQEIYEILQKSKKQSIVSKKLQEYGDLFFYIKKNLLVRKKILTREISQTNEKFQDYYEEAIGFFQKNLANVEINKEDQLYKQYFPILPSCTYLTTKFKQDFHNNANRTNIKTKLESMYEQKDQILTKLQHEELLQSWFDKYILLYILQKQVSFIKDISFILCLVQNFILILSYSVFRKIEDQVYKRENVRYQVRLDYFGELSENQGTQSEQLLAILGITQCFLIILILLVHLLRYSAVHYKTVIENTTYKQLNNLENNLKQKIWFVWLFFKSLCNDKVFVYYSLQTLCALASVFIHKLFVAILLYDIVWRSPLLAFVIQSVWRPKKTMLMTYILFLLAECVYAILAYYYFYEDLHGYCDRLWICLIRFMDQSFKQNAGIGSFIDSIDGKYQTSDDNTQNFNQNLFGDTEETPAVKWGRVFYDFTSFFIPVVIIIQIVTGVIADTFEVLRKEEEERNQDMLNVCFMCGLERNFIEEKMRNKQGFETHTKEEHYLWHYFFYMAYLEKIDKTDYTGHESYVAECLEKNLVDWFPINKGLSFGNVQKEDDSSNSNLLNEFNQKFDSIDLKIQQIQEIIENQELKEIPKQKNRL